MGAIQTAALFVLGQADSAMTPREVRTAVEERLGVPVSQDTISSFLSVACRSVDPLVQRVERGLYSIT